MPRPNLEIADIFRRYGPAWRRANSGHVSLSQLKVMSAIEACRTEALGGHVAACTRCDYDHIAYNSCKNRHCPKCQGPAARDWMEARAEDLLPVEYFHVVFTLPAEIAQIAYWNKRACKVILDSLQTTPLHSCEAKMNSSVGFFDVNCDRVLQGYFDTDTYALELGESISSNKRLQYRLESASSKSSIIEFQTLLQRAESCKERKGQECKISPLFSELISKLSNVDPSEPVASLQFVPTSFLFSSRIEEIDVSIFQAKGEFIVFWVGGSAFYTSLTWESIEFFYVIDEGLSNGSD